MIDNINNMIYNYLKKIFFRLRYSLTYIAILGAIFFLYSCENNYDETYYDTGEIRTKIYLDNNLDTNKIVYLSKIGKIISEKYFLPYDICIYKTITDTVGYLKTRIVYPYDTFKYKLNPIIDNGIEITKEGEKYGIHHFINHNDIHQNQDLLFISGKLIAYSHYRKNKITGYYNKYQKRILKDSLTHAESVLVFNEGGKLIEEKSLGYIVNSRDTIYDGENFTFKIEYLTGKIKGDSILCGIDIGTLDTNFVISNITHTQGGVEKENIFTYKTPSIGYHYITGKIRILGYDYINRKKYDQKMLFFHDYYVIEKP